MIRKRLLILTIFIVFSRQSYAIYSYRDVNRKSCKSLTNKLLKASGHPQIVNSLAKNREITDNHLKLGKLYTFNNERYAILDTASDAGESVRFLFDLNTKKIIQPESLLPGRYLLSNELILIVKDRYTQTGIGIYQLAIMAKENKLATFLFINSEIQESYFHTGKLYTFNNNKFAILEAVNNEGQTLKFTFDLATNKVINQEVLDI